MYIIYDIEYLMYKYNSQICDGVSYMRCNKCSIDHMPHVTNIVYMYIAYYLYLRATAHAADPSKVWTGSLVREREHRERDQWGDCSVL